MGLVLQSEFISKIVLHKKKKKKNYKNLIYWFGTVKVLCFVYKEKWQYVAHSIVPFITFSDFYDETRTKENLQKLSRTNSLHFGKCNDGINATSHIAILSRNLHEKQNKISRHQYLLHRSKKKTKSSLQPKSTNKESLVQR